VDVRCAGAKREGARTATGAVTGRELLPAPSLSRLSASLLASVGLVWSAGILCRAGPARRRLRPAAGGELPRADRAPHGFGAPAAVHTTPI